MTTFTQTILPIGKKKPFLILSSLLKEKKLKEKKLKEKKLAGVH